MKNDTTGMVYARKTVKIELQQKQRNMRGSSLRRGVHHQLTFISPLSILEIACLSAYSIFIGKPLLSACLDMEPDFLLIGLLLEYRMVMRCFAAVNILSGLGTFLLETLRLSHWHNIQKGLSLSYAGIWIGITWIATGLFAILASKSATHYHRLRGYSVGSLCTSILSWVICFFAIIYISYFAPFVGFPNLSSLEINQMVLVKSSLVILSVTNLFTSTWEVVFGVCQFKSGYFRVVNQWTQSVPSTALFRSQTAPTWRPSTDEPGTDAVAVEPISLDERPKLRPASTKKAVGLAGKRANTVHGHATARKTKSAPGRSRSEKR